MVSFYSFRGRASLCIGKTLWPWKPRGQCWHRQYTQTPGWGSLRPYSYLLSRLCLPKTDKDRVGIVGTALGLEVLVLLSMAGFYLCFVKEMILMSLETGSPCLPKLCSILIKTSFFSYQVGLWNLPTGGSRQSNSTFFW